ncbi:MAG: LON peptidase substrate-binding domain-containing protein [Acidobacteria bacterium]|nr:LON peptidase substrate-binding domain-containing protein [Acidobacteriota bacterium]
MLPGTIPIFPLPNVVLFPNVFLPLHIFEPRYRAMVADALEGDRIIGMVLLQPGYEANYDGRPPVFSVGCAGVITHAEALGDGRYDIVLRGLERFRITGEDHVKAYRLAHIDALSEDVPSDDRSELRRHRHRLEALLAAALERTGAEPRFPPAVADEDLVNALAQYIEFDPLERQALLEQHGVLARCRALIDLLEMKTLSRRSAWNGKSVH